MSKISIEKVTNPNETKLYTLICGDWFEFADKIYILTGYIDDGCERPKYYCHNINDRCERVFINRDLIVTDIKKIEIKYQA